MGKEIEQIDTDVSKFLQEEENVLQYDAFAILRQLMQTAGRSF